MKKFLIGLTVVAVSILLFVGSVFSSIPAKSIEKATNVTVSIVSYFPRENGGWNLRVGAGVLLGVKDDNWVLSARHLFVDDDGLRADHIFGIMPGFREPVEMSVIYITDGSSVFDDYAILRFKVAILRRGIEIRNHDFILGEDIIFIGTTGGLIFNQRIGFATVMQYHYDENEKGQVVVKPFEDFPYLQVWPGGMGDSGGGIYDRDGKLIGMIYCSTGGYMNSNPLRFLRAFLKTHGLERLYE